MKRFVGSTHAKAAAAVLVAAFLGALAALWSLAPGGPRGLLRIAIVVLGFLTALALIHATRRGFAAWMKGAAVLQRIVTTILFGACYILVVPLFALLARLKDPLGLRTRSEDTYWIPRKRSALDRESLRRMA